MRQVYRASAAGVGITGAVLPDGGPVSGVMIDNPSGCWYQVLPGADWVAPYTQGYAASFDGAPSVDVVYSPNGPAGQTSIAAGDPISVTVYDDAEAPGPDRGNSLAWLATGQSGMQYLGSFTPGYPAAVTVSYTVPPTTRAIAILLPSRAGYLYDGNVSVHGVVNGMSVGFSSRGPSSWFVAPIAPDYYPGGIWDVSLLAGAAVPIPTPAFVFALTSLPLAHLSVGVGQALMAGSVPVVIARDQGSFPVSLDLASLPVAVTGPLGSGWHPVSEAVPVIAAANPTYAADSSIQVQLPSATGRVWFYIFSGVTKIRLKRLRIEQYALATTAGQLLLALSHQNVAPTGGTAGAPRAFDTGNAPSTTAVGFVSASTFASDGTVGVRLLPIVVPVASAAGPGPGGTSQAAGIELAFGQSPGEQQPGTMAGFCLYYVGNVGVTGTPTFVISFEWGEA